MESRVRREEKWENMERMGWEEGIEKGVVVEKERL